MHTERFSNPERLPEPPQDASLRSMYSTPTTRRRHAEAQQIGNAQYRVYEVHSYGGLFGTVKERPLSLKNMSVLPNAVWNRNDARNVLEKWEIEQRITHIPGQKVVRPATQTGFHHSRFKSQNVVLAAG